MTSKCSSKRYFCPLKSTLPYMQISPTIGPVLPGCYSKEYYLKPSLPLDMQYKQPACRACEVTGVFIAEVMISSIAWPIEVVQYVHSSAA